MKYERFRAKSVIALIMVLFFVFSCTMFNQMTGKQKYLMARGTFNDAVRDYVRYANQQPEEMKAKLRENTPMIKDAEKALDAWGLAYDDKSKEEAYATISDTLFAIFVTYGIEIKEGP